MDLQTFVLRVTIHCHGCKKKVRKVLKSVEGVQDVKVDAQLHKVMVTGTVDAETLIKRLNKSGKQALPWQHTPAKNPDPAPADAPAPAEDGSKDAAVADKKPAEEPQADSSDKKPEQETASEKKPEQETASEKKPETEKEAESEKKADKEEAKPSDEAKKDGGEGAAAEPKPKAKGTEPAAAAKEAGDDEGEAKKKQSKPKDADRSLAPAPAPAHAPRYAHQEFNAPQPVMSYNMAQPRASVSHYAPPPAQQAYSQQAQPMQQWSPSYLYMPYPHASPESYYQDYYSPPGTHASPPPPPPLQDSYRLFDDENPNSCSVM
ncbi:unnamed protein product [Triticum turgidum subsp. durum]|uniref:HMA domain-containing protein n=1 Tax=Triticum turgidum subsp. durum TaxID=4567 RepID=A0A9R0WYU1_TRITD|nr:unnamed protein product [Triticum turgidum subsp. durum]